MTRLSTTATLPEISGFVPGVWTIDPIHSDVSFTVRHLMVSKVRGHFTKFEGEIDIAANPFDSSVTASIDLSSVDTRDKARDSHLRSPDFFDVANFPRMTFRSTRLDADGDGVVVAGDLTVHGITRPIELRLEINGVGSDPWGGTRAGFSASTELSRKDFGIDIAMPLDGGGVVVGDRITVALEIEAILSAG